MYVFFGVIPNIVLVPLTIFVLNLTLIQFTHAAYLLLPVVALASHTVGTFPFSVSQKRELRH